MRLVTICELWGNCIITVLIVVIVIVIIIENVRAWLDEPYLICCCNQKWNVW
jgi:hypothetical protein